MNKLLLTILTIVITSLVEHATPHVKTKLQKLIGVMEERAKASRNKIDDRLVEALKEVLNGLIHNSDPH